MGARDCGIWEQGIMGYGSKGLWDMGQGNCGMYMQKQKNCRI